MLCKAVISIIDDDDGVRKSLQTLLQALDYTVHTFESVEEFLASPQLRQTSCVISDVQMPGRSGIELSALLSAKGCHIPVILVTGCPDERVRDRAIGAGAISLLDKPFDAANLVRFLDRALQDD